MRMTVTWGARAWTSDFSIVPISKFLQVPLWTVQSKSSYTAGLQPPTNTGLGDLADVADVAAARLPTGHVGREARNVGRGSNASIA